MAAEHKLMKSTGQMAKEYFMYKLKGSISVPKIGKTSLANKLVTGSLADRAFGCILAQRGVRNNPLDAYHTRSVNSPFVDLEKVRLLFPYAEGCNFPRTITDLLSFTEISVKRNGKVVPLLLAKKVDYSKGEIDDLETSLSDWITQYNSSSYITRIGYALRVGNTQAAASFLNDLKSLFTSNPNSTFYLLETNIRGKDAKVGLVIKIIDETIFTIERAYVPVEELINGYSFDGLTVISTEGYGEIPTCIESANASSIFEYYEKTLKLTKSIEDLVKSESDNTSQVEAEVTKAVNAINSLKKSGAAKPYLRSKDTIHYSRLSSPSDIIESEFSFLKILGRCSNSQLDSLMPLVFHFTGEEVPVKGGMTSGIYDACSTNTFSNVVLWYANTGKDDPLQTLEADGISHGDFSPKIVNEKLSLPVTSESRWTFRAVKHIYAASFTYKDCQFIVLAPPGDLADTLSLEELKHLEEKEARRRAIIFNEKGWFEVKAFNIFNLEDSTEFLSEEKFSKFIEKVEFLIGLDNPETVNATILEDYNGLK